jgi:hypothetical protein
LINDGGKFFLGLAAEAYEEPVDQRDRPPAVCQGPLTLIEA